jgi:hypothetical protein
VMSLGQVAEVTSVHLDTKAAPHRIHLELMLKLPLMRNFMVPVAHLAKASQVSPRPLRSSMLPCATVPRQGSRRTRRPTQQILQEANLKEHLHLLT